MITIDVSTIDVRNMLRKLSGKLDNMTPVMNSISGIMWNSVEENFRQQGRPGWESLKPSTIKQRERKGYVPIKILTRRGELAASCVPGHDEKSAWVSTNKKYARIHQEGGDVRHPAHNRKQFFKEHKRGIRKGRRLFASESKASYGMNTYTKAYTTHIPARPFLKLTDGDMEKIKTRLGEYLITGI